MKRLFRGFTLIELMIAIAIVALLVALAVPAYNDYSIRSKITECVHGAAVAKTSISEYHDASGQWPPSEDEATTGRPAGESKFCTGFNYLGNGNFEIEVDETAIDSGLGNIQPQMYAQSNSSGGVDWFCQRGTTASTDLKYLPSSCRGANS